MVAVLRELNQEREGVNAMARELEESILAKVAGILEV